MKVSSGDRRWDIDAPGSGAAAPWGRHPIGPGFVRRLTLFWRVFLVDAAVLVVAVVLLAAGPLTISAPIALQELAVLLAGLVAMLLVTLALLHRAMRPLESLTQAMRRIDPLSPGTRVAIEAPDADVAALTAAFNDMLERLETERRESARVSLVAQEEERRRVAHELHDEVGQTLTAMLLQIEGVAADVPGELRGTLEELRETARSGAEDVRRIARRLRPEALDDLGLPRALDALAGRMEQQSGVRIERSLPGAIELATEEELVVYRVAQEALTNVVRHAGAERAEVSLSERPDGVVLRVADDGRGASPAELASSYGVRGMRERALLIGARLTLDSQPGRGTEVVLFLSRGRPA